MNETGIKRLGNLGQFIRGSGISKADIVSNGGLPSIRYGEIYTKYGEVITKLVSQVSISGAQSALRLKIGDILFPTSGETAEDIGKAVTYIGETEAYAGSDIMTLRDHGENPIYLAHALNTWEANRQKFRLAEGGPIVHIYVSELAQLSVWLPSLPEQQKIAEILSDCDATIEAITALLAQKNKFLAGYRNQVMASLSNLPSISLGSVAVVKIDNPVETLVNEKMITVSLHCKGIKLNSNSRAVISEKGRTYHRRFAGEFLIGRQSIHNGGFGFLPNELDGGLASSAITSLLLDEEKIYPSFFLHYFKRSNFYKKLEIVMRGTCQKEMSDKELLKIKFPNIPINRQFEIGSLLDDLWDDINKTLEQLNLLKQQKHGLMQQLLTGKLYVKGTT